MEPNLEPTTAARDTVDYPQDTQLLPAWFTQRMMMDDWAFGLLLTSGKTLAISRIDAIVRDATGALWLDVEMLKYGEFDTHQRMSDLITAPTSRTQATVAAAHVVAAFELCDT